MNLQRGPGSMLMFEGLYVLAQWSTLGRPLAAQDWQLICRTQGDSLPGLTYS